MVAMNEHDVDTVLSLLADDAVVESDWDATTLVDLPARLEYERILGSTYDSDACIEVEPGALHCPYTGTNHLSRALGVAPFGPVNRFEFTIGSDGIEHVVIIENEGISGHAVEEVIMPFGNWVLENHPGDYAATFDPPLWRAEQRALWEQYVPEFVASLED